MPRHTSIKVENGGDFNLDEEVTLKIKGKVKTIEKRPDYGDEMPMTADDSEPKERDFVDIEYSDSEVTISKDENDFAKLAEDHENEAR